jgi:hypothetical protein
LLRTVQNVANLLPMDKVLTMEARHSREKLKATIDKIEIISGTANAWVGVEAGDYRVLVALR